MKIILSQNEVLEYVRKELEKSFSVDSVAFSDSNNEILAEVQPKKQSLYEEKHQVDSVKPKEQPGDNSEPRFIEGRGTMSSDRKKRDKNMKVF